MGGFCMFRKKVSRHPYNKETEQPVIKASICNGEQVAGFKEIATGKFTEVAFIRNRKDLEQFLETYDVNEADIKKEW